jgi:hypothetical protein
VYEKMNRVRQEFAGMSVKKSGKNKFAGYEYFELGDFLPVIQKLCSTFGLLTVVSFAADIAELVVIDTEKPDDKVRFTSPMGSANLKGCHEVQNIGAVETYQRRYLYQTAFEIVEHDALDATSGQADKPKVRTDGATGRQFSELRQLAKDFGEGTPEAKKLLAYADNPQLTVQKATEVIYSASAVLDGRRS